LLNFSPKGSKGFEIRDSVKILRIKGEVVSGHSYTPSKVYAKYLSNFSNLKFLKLERFEEITGFEEIYSLPIEGLEIAWSDFLPNHDEKWGFKKLKILLIDFPKKEKVDHLDFLSNIVTIETLKLQATFSAKSPDFSNDGLKFLEKLKYLQTSGLGYSNVDALGNLKNLNYVKLSEDNLSDISGLTSSENLEFIDLYYSKKLDNISPLNKLKNIKLIDISSTQISSLKGLENSVDIHGVKAVDTPIKNLDALVNAKNIYCVNAERCKHLENIEGLKNSVKLKEIILDYCSSLASLNGIENCKDLRVIKLSGSGISNLDSLTNCKKIFNNNKTKWDEETNEW
jgi:hypothetical protein